MFINDVNKKEEIKNIAIRHLRKNGIKFRDKTPRQILQVNKCKKFFKVPLQSLPHQTVTLKNGQQLVIPKQLYEICCFICRKAETEGIFRKEGSKSRQNEIKLLLDRGCLLGDDHHVIDVAVILKRFLRELPEPLIPFSYHELFLRCSLVEKKVETILLACLLLPSEHLNVLSFLMQFLNEVTNHADQNKMDTYNISILVGPNIFPISEKVSPKNKLMVTRICDIIKLMIEHSRNIGVIPEYIIEQIHTSNDVEVVDRSKRRRSGSLTRIFNGLKKIVGNRQDEETTTVTPDLLLTPSISSSKKKEENNRLQRKHRLKDENVTKRNGTKAVLERRWSAITHATNFKRKKRHSSIELPHRDINKYEQENKDTSKADYVKVSKQEYEEIKNRVSAIEKRLSFELENVQSTIACENSDRELNNIIQNIQSVYEQTLVHSEPLCSGTDQIAKRLSRELRIRNSEQKMIRSPSARKIGNMRRRSRELDRPNNKMPKNQSFRFVESKQPNSKLIRNNPSTTKSDTNLSVKYSHLKNSEERPLKQSASFHNRLKSTHIYRNSSTHVSFNSFDRSPTSGAIKKSSLFDIEMICDDEIISSSELKRLHNAPTLPNHDFSDPVYVNIRSNENLTKASYRDKISNRIKPMHERSSPKQNISPLKRSNNVRQRGKHQEKLYTEIKRLCRSNKENDFISQGEDLNKQANVDCSTPKIVPHIKRPMIIKSPKRLCSTPQNYHRNTPMKVLSASNCYSPGVY